MSSSCVLLRVERVEAATVLTINRPETGNAINLELARVFASALRTCADVPDGRAIITGAGEKFFCSGGDLKAYSGIESPKELEIAFGTARALMDEIENIRVPVIAVINGYALGGGLELALACDIRIASAKAKLGFPQAQLGIIPGWNGIERLVSLVGRSRALHLLLTAERIGTERAKETGLIDYVADGDVLEAALAYVRQFERSAPLALRASKEAVLATLRNPREEARRVASDLFKQLWFSADHREAEQAFVGKRAPTFQGR